MGVIGDVGRYFAFAALLFGFFASMRRLAVWQLRERLGRKRRILLILAALSQSAGVWVGLVVVIAPLTGVLSLSPL